MLFLPLTFPYDTQTFVVTDLILNCFSSLRERMLALYVTFSQKLSQSLLWCDYLADWSGLTSGR